MNASFLGLSIEEWFKYHPPTTDEHRAKHADVNALALGAARCIGANYPNALGDFHGLVTDLTRKIEHTELKNWVAKNIEITSADSNFDKMMKLQQLRMIANQSITVADLQKGESV